MYLQIDFKELRASDGYIENYFILPSNINYVYKIIL